ncbi:hypothetical protein VHA01S_020_00700 [Vibrio halioticoli NBRC 102217]|uniref:Uncharacterized protein n=1 Tax=Vibrio halioticoli NBRC 102217 TaxID=1219072 RepID=V5FD51_9VIBR|nr:hypothetical protein [Vibrio halioticoli]GAD89488.1 hypothetical protein VHA01S_020_00700 [Vibrio halioticoli NBRC 102217]
MQDLQFEMSMLFILKVETAGEKKAVPDGRLMKSVINFQYIRGEPKFNHMLKNPITGLKL